MDLKFLIFSCFFISLSIAKSDEGIGPIFIWHGISECDEFIATQRLKTLFESRGALVKTVRIGNTCFDDTVASYLALEDQITYVCDQLSNDTDFINGVTIVGLSQGGLMGRALVQMCPAVNVTTLISAGGPHSGTFGLPLCEALTSELFMWFCFKARGLQEFIGVGPTGLSPFFSLIADNSAIPGYWNDPFRKAPPFLDSLNKLNNVVLPKKEYKENFLRLKKFIAIHFDPDGAIHPPSSARFDEYKSGSLEIIPYNETDHYKQDLIGLRTLDETGRYFPIEYLGIHMNFTLEWFEEEIINKHLVGQMSN